MSYTCVRLCVVRSTLSGIPEPLTDERAACKAITHFFYLQLTANEDGSEAIQFTHEMVIYLDADDY